LLAATTQREVAAAADHINGVTLHCRRLERCLREASAAHATKSPKAKAHKRTAVEAARCGLVQCFGNPEFR